MEAEMSPDEVRRRAQCRCPAAPAQTQSAPRPEPAHAEQAAKNALLTVYVELGNVLASPLLDLGPRARMVLSNLHAISHAGLMK